MLNLLLLLIFLSCLGIVSAWVAGNPGSVTIHWFDYQIDTSFAFLLLLAIVGAALLAYSWLLVRSLILAPALFSESRRLKHYQKGLTELTHSIAALAVADVENAKIHTRKAEKQLGRAPLIMLLTAQIARSQGDDAQTKLLLEQMLNHKETEYLAARSLSEVASKQQHFPKALSLAERAQALNPKGTDSLVSLQIRLGHWQEALTVLAQAARKRQISRAELRRWRGIVHLEHGKVLLDEGRYEMALVVARQSLKELPGFVPAVVLMAHALDANDQQAKAIKLIFQTWKTSPHPQLSAELRELMAGEPRDKQDKTLRKLESINSRIPENGLWTCSHCGHTAPQWSVHCVECDSFDTMAWV